MSERVAEKQDQKEKLNMDVSGGIATNSPTNRTAAGRYVQPAFTRSGEAWVKQAEEDEPADGSEYDALNAASPLTSVGTTPESHVITPPADAKHLYLMAAAAIRYGDNLTLDGTTGNGYAYLPAYVESQGIPCADGSNIWVRINASSGTTTVYFRFDDKE